MDTQPSTHYHSSFVSRFNNDHPAAQAEFPLAEDLLLGAARKETGLTEFGDESFLSAMRIMHDAVTHESAPNAFGLFNARMRALRSLTNRLWANACFEARPEIRLREIAAPLIIVGLHRSGTTRLQRMLAVDPRLQYLSAWEGFNPAPRLTMPELGKAARYAEVHQALTLGGDIYPGAFTAHPMHADWPEEEMLLLNHSFAGFSALGLHRMPTYFKWFLEDPKRDAYRYMADLLKLVGWSRGAPGERRWVLKNPQHMLDLPTLMETFPDAKLVFVHRDPLKTVGSVMSLMWFYAVQNTDLPARSWIRDTWMTFYEEMARRSIEARRAIPAAQQIDVYFDAMNEDWRGEMQRIYDFAAIEFTSETETAMADWLAESAREGHHGGHRYALEDFGTSAEEVDARMKFYRDHYAIRRETAKS